MFVLSRSNSQDQITNRKKIFTDTLNHEMYNVCGHSRHNNYSKTADIDCIEFKENAIARWFLTDMDNICALAQISGVQEPLGTLNGWSCLGRFLANFCIVMNPTCPKIFANILRTTRLLHCTEEPLGLRLPNATPELYSGEHNCERMRISWPCGELHRE